MAKESKIARNRQRERMVRQHRERRAELVAVIKDPNATPEAKEAAYRKLYKMPRDASPTRYRNRCNISGRPRAYIRDFGVSRIVFRELANQGMFPGVKKASW